MKFKNIFTLTEIAFTMQRGKLGYYIKECLLRATPYIHEKRLEGNRPKCCFVSLFSIF